MIELYNDKSNCYGCGACFNVCPKKAITMKMDDKGFFYPEINNSICCECGLCKKVCQISKEKELLREKTELCFAVKNNDKIRMISSSGGVYSSISDIILSENGCCVGAAYDDNMNVVHLIARSVKERNLFRGSKYVQSDMGTIYSKIADLLNQRKKVLFSGTPCQVSGLLFFLKEKNVGITNLVTNDLVCHGVPAPGVWQSYLSFLNKKYESKLVKFSFRNKKNGWKGYHIKAEFENGTIINDSEITQTYIKLFNRDLILRPSCYKCPYASLNRVGDLTIADFWDIEEIDYSFLDDIGVSMVFVNSDTGKKIFKEILEDPQVIVRAYPTNLLKQHNLYNPTQKGVFYKDFWRTYLRKGFKRAAYKYGGLSGSKTILYKMRDALVYKYIQIRKRS